MPETLWVRARSWHVFRTWTRTPGRLLTLCGRTINGAPDLVGTFPGGERTCESCLRISAKETDE